MASKIVASFGNMMTNAFLILLTVIFILAEEVGFSEKLRSSSSDSAKTLQGIERFTASVNQYMAIKTLLSLVTAVLIMLWLWVLGVDYIVLWGLLAFLLNFIPNLGSILAALPVVLLALVQLGPMTAILTALGYLLVNVVIGNAIEPRFMGKGLDLSALVVFLSLVFWGWVLGSVGMLLSVPLTMTVKIALESSDDTRWLGVMLGSGRSAKQA
jgi:predicted PurR-regulated permease PerM